MIAGDGRKGHPREEWQTMQTHTGVKRDGRWWVWRVEEGSVIWQLRSLTLARQMGRATEGLKVQVISSGMNLKGPFWWGCVGRSEERKANMEAIEKVQVMNRKDEKMKGPPFFKRTMCRIWRCPGKKKSLGGFLSWFAYFCLSGSSAICVFYLTWN